MISDVGAAARSGITYGPVHPSGEVDLSRSAKQKVEGLTMGKALEEFAVTQLLLKLDLPATATRLQKNKRRALFDAIVRTRHDCLSNIGYDTMDECWSEFRDSIPPLPDGLVIDEENATAFFIEIEDKNPLSEERLNHYSSAFWMLDSVYWDFRLFVSNRYGQNHHEIDVVAWSVSQHAKQRDARR